MYTRRTFTTSLLAASALAAKPGNVTLGAQTYSLRDRDADKAVAALKELQINTVEMWSGHAEPFSGKVDREEVRKWRLSVPLSHFTTIRKKFNDNGITIHAYNYSFREDFTDAEVARGFEFADALGAKIITASSNVSTAKRVDPFARKAKIRVGMHNHSRIVANEFATPENFLEAMNGMSKYICINLDIGHFTAANFDPVEFLGKWHKRIVTLHIKDRRKNQGPNVVFGEGDTPIKATLLWLKQNNSAIPANIEYEYRGSDTMAEMKRCLDYMRKVVG
ncbi:MAG: sugar phosphate isomerase/epimerase family protein [Acidobacteriota bacterium]|jgi:sugar phosphate isomerase/epimerase|nr:sugar phosphate isomerase/epimerase [Bryobacteraceae bacterium CoA2 C42]MCA2965542.1 TIM barrel protein [Acidobacteriaceae bacterium]